MSDQELRLLARDADHDSSARTRLLVARLRAGELDANRLCLAAECGDREAGLVTGRSANTTFYLRWSLWHYGKAPAVIAAVSAARLLVPLWKKLGDAEPFEAIEAAESWLACPCQEHRRTAVEVAGRIVKVGRARGIGLYAGRPAWHAVLAAARADRNERERRAARRASRDAHDAVSHVLQIARRETRTANAALVSAVNKKVLADTVNAALREWALR